ncbi:TniB family NTP-binding protein [Actinomadura soli]|nr:TniB family NTP-binding protein [Actinomadura soli]
MTGELEVGDPEDLTHLHEAARRVARLPAAERLAYVRADRWIGYTGATRVITRLEELLTWPAKQRMPNLLLIGPTNNGTSMIVEKFRRTHPPISPPWGCSAPGRVGSGRRGAGGECAARRRPPGRSRPAGRRTRPGSGPGRAWR